VPELIIEVEPRLGAAAQTRQVLDERFRGEVPGGLLQDLLVVVSELVNNSVVHGPKDGPIQTFVLVDDAGLVQGKVEDGGDPSEAIPAAKADLGPGLQIVDALVDRWAADGSTVWFEMRDADGSE
jgi:two-component sensor histidine kinase